MYIYRADGTLFRFLEDTDPDFSMNLSTEVGYQNLKSTLLEALTETQP